MVFLGHGVVISGLWARETGWLHDAIGYMGTVGFFGVDLFFVLSAYLLTKLMLRDKKSRGSLDIPGFYLRRLLRIWPTFPRSPSRLSLAATGRS
jgi:peptidoglycan/LPS O-acetylase OafA/YrhL